MAPTRRMGMGVAAMIFVFVVGTTLTLSGMTAPDSSVWTTGGNNSRQKSHLSINNYNNNKGAVQTGGDANKNFVPRVQNLKAWGPNDKTTEKVAAIKCPPKTAIQESAPRDMYNNLIKRYGEEGHELFEYSFYQMRRDQWDLILSSHVAPLSWFDGDETNDENNNNNNNNNNSDVDENANVDTDEKTAAAVAAAIALAAANSKNGTKSIDPPQFKKGLYKPGDWIFETGMAAGATLDSLQRQFGVRIAGIDIADQLIDFANQKLEGKFCAADATDLSFVPDNIFEHSLSFGVFMYLDEPAKMCKAMKELIRIVKPGGTIFIGQANDLARDGVRPSQAQGNSAVSMLYWYRFAHDLGITDVRVLRASQVYSKRAVPEMDTYDLHAESRYNIYMRKPMTPINFDDMDCNAVESSAVVPRYTVSGVPCHLPFYYKGILFDDCTNAQSSNGEWCATKRSLTEKEAAENGSPAWGFCKPAESPRKALWKKHPEKKHPEKKK